MKYFSCILLLGTLSCATQDVGLYHLTANKKKLKELLSYIHNNPSYQEKKSRLLYHLNLGSIHHIHEQYHASNMELVRAKSLMRELYTQSLSKKAQTLILNDQYDIYYGERYEHSLVYFYLSLNHFLLWQQGEIGPWFTWKDNQIKKVKGKTLSKQERKESLMAARAELLDWDSFLKEWKVQTGHDDMLTKTYGAIVHEAVATRNDLQIALQLYKDALKLLKNHYKKYKSFHKNQQEKDNLNYFLKEKIISLTKKIRPHQLKKTAKSLRIDDKALKNINESNNVTFIIQTGQIPLKAAKKHYYSLEKAIRRPGVSGAVAQIGASVLTLFASKQLGLLPAPEHYSPQAVYTGLTVAEAGIRGVAISFELPKIAPSQPSPYSLAIFQNGQKVLEKSVPLLSPLGDIAAEAVANKSLARYERIGLRLAGKYAALIATTYAIFKKNDNFLARQAALLSFAAGSHLIGQSEKADLRYWSTLPGNIRMINMHLAPGNYEWKLYQDRTNNYLISQGMLSVNKAEHQILNIQELSPDKN